MNNKPLVYIASPYTKGDPGINTRFQMHVFNRLILDDVVWPFAPLWSHYQHIMYPLDYDAWTKFDLAILERCDA